MKRFILAEKDKQAEAYAKALGSYQERKGVYHLTSSYLPGELHIYAPEGHLFEYMEPEDNWDLAHLPLVDVPFQMTLAKGKKKRFETIYREVQWADEVIIATDADREGERIAYSILTRIPGGKDKITSRLWGQSLSAEGIQANFQALRDPRETYNYYLEAEARAQSDWLVGMNLSPLVTLTLQEQQRLARGKGTSLSVGRVQTALVRVVVENDTRIKNFQPQSYWRLFFEDKGYQLDFVGTETFDSSEEALMTARQLGNRLEVVEIADADHQKLAPQLFKTSSLQWYCASQLKIDTKTSEEILESLYLKGFISYPRTGSAYITEGEFSYLKYLVSDYQGLVSRVFEVENDQPRDLYVDAEQLDSEGHYAIIPTETLPNLFQLDRQERLIYEAIVKRTLLMFAGDYLYQTQTVTLASQDFAFNVKGRRNLSLGWTELADRPPRKDVLLPPFAVGQVLEGQFGVKEQFTKPPKRLTEAQLFGQVFDYYGLGTPATRTDIFQKILKRGYVKQDKKTGQLFPERKAYLLIDFMYDNEFSNPETTGDWEDFLKQIGQGQLNPRDFVEAIKDKVKTQVETVKEEGHF